MTRRVAWVLVGLGSLGCNPTEKLVAGAFDAGREAPAVVDAERDVPALKDGGATRGLGLDGGVCSAATLGPVEEGPGRYTVAWTFSAAPAADAGTSSADREGTDSADSPSRCVASAVDGAGSYEEYLCHGGAWLRPGAGGPVLTFDDGSTLTWNPDAPPAPAPYVQPTGERVWASYQTGFIFLCRSCTSYGTNQWLEIRDTGASGTIRHYAQQGSNLSSPVDLATQMFGVPVSENALCKIHVSGCLSLDRTEYDHRVATIPSQTVPFATLTAVTSPGGTYDLVWAATSDTNVQEGACVDTPGPTNDSGFVATRRAP